MFFCDAFSRGSNIIIDSELLRPGTLRSTTRYSENGYIAFFFLLHRLSPMEPINEVQRCPSRVWIQGVYPSLSGSPLRVLSQCRFSTPTPRQPMVELFVFTSARFPLWKSEEKCTSTESRTHEFRLRGRKLYPLDHRVV